MYISSKDQVIDYTYNTPHCAIHTPFPLVRARKLDSLAISQKTSREQLIVYVERRGFQVVRVHWVHVIVGD